MTMMMISRVVYVDDDDDDDGDGDDDDDGDDDEDDDDDGDDDDCLKLIVPEGDGGWRICGLVPDIGHHPHGLA